METMTEVKKKNYYSAKLYREDFSGKDLAHANFRNASLIGCNFTDANLAYADFDSANCREANFTRSILYRANFKDAALADSIFDPKDAFGMTITLSCETVDGMKIGKIWWFVWLMMALRNKLWSSTMHTLILSVMACLQFYVHDGSRRGVTLIQ